MKLKKLLTGLILTILISGQIYGQGVCISNDNSQPDGSAMLDIKSTNKGILIPRVQLDDITTALPITNPADGLLIYNETGSEMHGFYYWDGTASRWRAVNNLQEQDNNVFQLEGRLKDKSGIIMPVGTVLPFAGVSSQIPEGWLPCNGSILNKYDNPEYSDLYDVIGNVWGGASGADFKVPDLRAATLRGVGTSVKFTKNVTISLGQIINDQFQGHFHGMSGSGAAAYYPGADDALGGTYATRTSGSQSSPTSPISDGSNGSPRTGSETTGKAIGMNYIIKY